MKSMCHRMCSAQLLPREWMELQLGLVQEYVNYQSVTSRLGPEENYMDVQVQSDIKLKTAIAQAVEHLRSLQVAVKKAAKLVEARKADLEGDQGQPRSAVQIAQDKIYGITDIGDSVQAFITEISGPLKARLIFEADSIESKLKQLKDSVHDLMGSQSKSWKGALTAESSLDDVLKAAKIMEDQTEGKKVNEAKNQLDKDGDFLKCGVGVRPTGSSLLSPT